MPVLKNSRHELFAQELAKGKTQVDAYEAAGYKSNDGNAAKLANDPEITGRVKEITGKVANLVVERTGINKAWVITRLVQNFERAMQVEEIQDRDGGTGEFEYDGAVANRALELLGKELGMFIDRKEVGQPGEFGAMNDAELMDQVAFELEKKGIDGSIIRQLLIGSKDETAH